MPLTRRAACLAAPALGVLLGERCAQAASEAITLLSGAPSGSLSARWVQGFAPLLERHWLFSTVRVVTAAGGQGLLAAELLAAAPSGTLGVVSMPQLLSEVAETGASDLFRQLVLVAAVVEETVVLLGQGGDASEPVFRGPTGVTTLLGTPQQGSAAALVARALVERGAAVDPIGFINPAAARKAVESGSVPLALLALPDAIGSVRDGRLVAIAVAATQRTALLAETPTLAELGQPVSLVGRRGIVLPRTATPDYTTRLGTVLSAIVMDPEFVAQSLEQGYQPRLVRGAEWEAECRRLLKRIAVTPR